MHNREQSPIHGPICHMSILPTMSYIMLILVSMRRTGKVWTKSKSGTEKYALFENYKIISISFFFWPYVGTPKKTQQETLPIGGYS